MKECYRTIFAFKIKHCGSNICTNCFYYQIYVPCTFAMIPIEYFPESMVTTRRSITKILILQIASNMINGIQTIEYMRNRIRNRIRQYRKHSHKSTPISHQSLFRNFFDGIAKFYTKQEKKIFESTFVSIILFLFLILAVFDKNTLSCDVQQYHITQSI